MEALKKVVVVALLAASAVAAPVKYDQRQEGEYNVHAHLENIVLVFIPSSSGSGISLLDLATRGYGLKSHDKQQHVVKTQDVGDTHQDDAVVVGQSSATSLARSSLPKKPSFPKASNISPATEESSTVSPADISEQKPAEDELKPIPTVAAPVEDVPAGGGPIEAPAVVMVAPDNAPAAPDMLMVPPPEPQHEEAQTEKDVGGVPAVAASEAADSSAAPGPDPADTSETPRGAVKTARFISEEAARQAERIKVLMAGVEPCSLDLRPGTPGACDQIRSRKSSRSGEFFAQYQKLLPLLQSEVFPDE